MNTFKNKDLTASNVIIVINATIFLLMFLSSGLSGFSNPRVLLNFGAHYGPYIRLFDEYFRLVTSMFVHGGLFHIFFNMYILYIYGNLIERIYGPFKLIVIYTTTGIAASIVTLIVNPNVLSVGASGAIFGLIGLLFGVGFRHDTPSSLNGVTGKSLLPFIVINLILGFTIGSINNAAHIGGLVTGIAFGRLLPVFPNPFSPYRKFKKYLWLSLSIISTFIVVLSFILLLFSNIFSKSLF